MLTKVAGNFHFAPGKSFQQMNMHVHDVLPLKMSSWNLTHTVRIAAPLSGILLIAAR